MAKRSSQNSTHGSVEYINPTGLIHNPAFTQLVTVTAPVKMVYIGMQNSVDGPSRAIVGQGDIAAQTEQTLKNLTMCLEAVGATPDQIIHWNIYVAHGQPIQPALVAWQNWWGNRANPPANSVIFVPEFTPTEFLIGIDAIAVIPL
jgi:enamine deaminase RidA (YjgF/YER057c/UK114 family)